MNMNMNKNLTPVLLLRQYVMRKKKFSETIFYFFIPLKGDPSLFRCVKSSRFDFARQEVIFKEINLVIVAIRDNNDIPRSTDVNTRFQRIRGNSEMAFKLAVPVQVSVKPLLVTIITIKMRIDVIITSNGRSCRNLEIN